MGHQSQPLPAVLTADLARPSGTVIKVLLVPVLPHIPIRPSAGVVFLAHIQWDLTLNSVHLHLRRLGLTTDPSS
jgi:hypothetical protein